VFLRADLLTTAPAVPATQAGAQTAAQAHDLLFVGSNNSYNVGGLADFLEANAMAVRLYDHRAAGLRRCAIRA